MREKSRFRVDFFDDIYHSLSVRFLFRAAGYSF